MLSGKEKSHLAVAFFAKSEDSDFVLAERTGLEPATPGVTGRYSNQLNYRSSVHAARLDTAQKFQVLRLGDPTGIRTPVPTVKGWCPRPLDDRVTNFQAHDCITFFNGGGKRDRTADLLHAMQALSQLSYTPA